MKAVPRGTWIVILSTTVSSTVVSDSPFRICGVMSLFVLIRSFDADKSDGCPSLDILDNQSVSRKSREMKFDGAPVPRR